MEKKSTEWLLFAIVCVSVASWITGCANHGSLIAAGPAGPSLSTAPSVKSVSDPLSLAGTWICADPRCAAGTIKKISPSLNSVQTMRLERLPPSSPASICRVQEIDRMSPGRSADHFEITPTLVQLINSPENTRDCTDFVNRANQIKPTSNEAEIYRDLTLPEISIDGVRYRSLSDGDLSTESQKLADANAKNGSISGDWVCIDEGCNASEQVISEDRKTLISDSVIELPSDGQKCHVSEQSEIEITDATEPENLYVTRVRGPLKLVDSAENMADCNQIVSAFNEDQTNNRAGDSEKLTIERNGNQEMLFLGKRYVRKE